MDRCINDGTVVSEAKKVVQPCPDVGPGEAESRTDPRAQTEPSERNTSRDMQNGFEAITIETAHKYDSMLQVQ